MYDRKAQLRDSNQGAGEGCPQADQQQDCGPGYYHVQNGWGRRSDRQQHCIRQRNSGCSAQEYQAGSR